ncbi:RNA polymerase sigma factor [Enterovibrio norvegicus]|uniref:RNA polymerase sigma factor n=1 Tax=Enterovibrio norvegicus TaxID=188144 RepID=UPI000C841FD3|nr:sigma-70 family RNA polymerase sigma factor [Enterovibrio norvegicus]PMN72155.1 hypothetical protein BCT27_14990 [Enterovibrio norvegicus]
MPDLLDRIDRLYRAESAKVLAALTRIFGAENIEFAEDTMQEAFGKALKHWKAHGEPENPGGWLMQTAKNHAIDVIRANKNKHRFSDDLSQFLESEWTLTRTMEREFSEEAIKDDTLRMIFWCCHPNLKPENQLPVILKLLCGFSLSAISRALLVPEETIKKRLHRTRNQLKQYPFKQPSPAHIEQALDTVHVSLYLLFNEGVYCSDGKKAIDIDFCREAMALVGTLVEAPHIANRETLALYALMHFHMARLTARTDANGHPIPLDLQERGLWERDTVRMGQQFITLATLNMPDTLDGAGRFCCEALIAQEHCIAKTFELTNWKKVEAHYARLIDVSASPVAKLNQAIAIAYQGQEKRALQRVAAIQAKHGMEHSHLPFAILAHIHAKSGNRAKAYQLAEEAQKRGGTQQEQQLMLAQIERLLVG